MDSLIAGKLSGEWYREFPQVAGDEKYLVLTIFYGTIQRACRSWPVYINKQQKMSDNALFFGKIQ